MHFRCGISRNWNACRFCKVTLDIRSKSNDMTIKDTSIYVCMCTLSSHLNEFNGCWSITVNPYYYVMLLHYIILYHIILYYIILYYIILYYIILYYIILYYIILYYNISYYIRVYYVLYYIILYYIILY